MNLTTCDSPMKVIRRTITLDPVIHAAVLRVVKAASSYGMMMSYSHALNCMLLVNMLHIPSRQDQFGQDLANIDHKTLGAYAFKKISPQRSKVIEFEKALRKIAKTVYKMQIEES